MHVGGLPPLCLGVGAHFPTDPILGASRGKVGTPASSVIFPKCPKGSVPKQMASGSSPGLHQRPRRGDSMSVSSWRGRFPSRTSHHLLLDVC